MEILEQSIIKDLAEKMLTQELREFKAMCIGVRDTLEEQFAVIDPQSYQLFKKLRQIFHF